MDLGNLTQKWVYDIWMNEEISTIDLDGSQPFISRFPFASLRGAQMSKDDTFFMESFACCERST